MSRWEYAYLFVNRVHEKEDPDDPSSRWTEPVIEGRLMLPGDSEPKLISSPGRSLQILATLNDLGRRGWEVMEIEVERAIYKDPVFDSGLAAWVRRTFWLKRPVT